MKILVNSRLYEEGPGTGIKNYIKNLFDEIQKVQNKDVILFAQIDDKQCIGTTLTSRIISFIPLALFRGVLFDQVYVLFLILINKPNVFFSPAHILPFFKVKNTKYVVTIHDLAFLVYPKHYSRLFRGYYTLAVRRSLKNADRIISVSQNTKNDIIKYYNIPESKIEVVHSGVDEFYFSREKQPALLSAKYFLSVVTHPKRKNIFSVLAAISSSELLKNYKYVISGLIRDENLSEFKKKIVELNLQENVILYGYAKKHELLNLYRNSVFFIYPSFYEGFGFPVVEAMAAKCPVITSNNSSLIEISPNKNWLVNPYSIDDIRSKMEKMLTLTVDERINLIEQNSNYSKNFLWSNAAKKTIDVFKNA